MTIVQCTYTVSLCCFEGIFLKISKFPKTNSQFSNLYKVALKCEHQRMPGCPSGQKFNIEQVIGIVKSLLLNKINLIEIPNVSPMEFFLSNSTPNKYLFVLIFL